MTEQRPILAFFTSSRSGPGRRMESLLSQLAHGERERLRVMRVDVEDRPELAERFDISVVPTLVLASNRRVVGRIEGRASATKIRRLLAESQPPDAADCVVA
jgi:thioredoxin 1